MVSLVETTIRVEGIKELEREFFYLGRQLPFITQVAVNDVAFQIRKAEQNEMMRVFDKPKPQTIRGVFVRKMTKTTPFAAIVFDQIYGGDEYMTANVEGGRRGMKKSESRFGRNYIPGAGARMDQYGNIRGSQITQILSVLGKAEVTAGYKMNTTARSALRHKKSKNAGNRDYFVVNQTRGGLKPGVYQRIQTSAGFGAQTKKNLPTGGAYQRGKTVGRFSSVVKARGVKPVLVFTKSPPTYQKRLDYFGIANQVFDREYRAAFMRAVDRAMRTAR